MDHELADCGLRPWQFLSPQGMGASELSGGGTARRSGELARILTASGTEVKGRVPHPPFLNILQNSRYLLGRTILCCIELRDALTL